MLLASLIAILTEDTHLQIDNCCRMENVLWRTSKIEGKIAANKALICTRFLLLPVHLHFHSKKGYWSIRIPKCFTVVFYFNFRGPDAQPGAQRLRKTTRPYSQCKNTNCRKTCGYIYSNFPKHLIRQFELKYLKILRSSDHNLFQKWIFYGKKLWNVQMFIRRSSLALRLGWQHRGVFIDQWKRHISFDTRAKYEMLVCSIEQRRSFE